MILFFDDIDVPENQLLGVVTSTGNVLVMQPNLHARFVTDGHHERGFLCNGKTGIIEKQLQWHTSSNRTQSVLSSEPTTHDEDDTLPALLETTIQMQLNPYMQLEYHNQANIRFAFACQKEEFKFQLGVPIIPQLITPIEQAALTNKKIPVDKKLHTKLKTFVNPANSMHSTSASITSEKQQMQMERLLDGQVNVKELPMTKELTQLRKRIRTICNDWLKQCRTILGKIFFSTNIKYFQYRKSFFELSVSFYFILDGLNFEIRLKFVKRNMTNSIEDENRY